MKYFLNMIAGAFLLSSCGSGDIAINRAGGQESVVSGPEASGLSAEDFFTSQLFPVLIKDRTGFPGGCAASKCHLKGDASDNEQKFYQIDKANAAESWKWAQVRRNRVIASSEFASSSAITLFNKKNQNHNTYSTWTNEEKALVDTWTGLAK